jgi:hypothetical protein
LFDVVVIASSTEDLRMAELEWARLAELLSDLQIAG